MTDPEKKEERKYMVFDPEEGEMSLGELLLSADSAGVSFLDHEVAHLPYTGKELSYLFHESSLNNDKSEKSRMFREVAEQFSKENENSKNYQDFKDSINVMSSNIFDEEKEKKNNETTKEFFKNDNTLSARFSNFKFEPLTLEQKRQMLQHWADKGAVTISSKAVMDAIMAELEKPENENITPRQMFRLARDMDAHAGTTAEAAKHARISARQERFRKRAHALPKPDFGVTQ